MEDRQTRNKALVIGLSQVSNREFLKTSLEVLSDLYKLADHKEPSELVNAKETLDALEDNLVLNLPLSLENKYYTADLSIWCDLNLLTDMDIDGYQNLVENYSQVGEVIDSVIFLMDPFVDIKTLKAWTDFLENFGPNVVLCLILKTTETDTEKLRLAEHISEKIAEFCNTNGIEPINFNEKENEGLERLYEALQANQWDGLVMKAGENKVHLKSNKDHFSDINRELLSDSETELPTAYEIEKMQKRIFGGTTVGSMELNENTLQVVQQLRESASSMSDKDRRELAAKVALSFSMQLDNDFEE